MTTFGSTAKPPWAVTMWSDMTAIYMELPVKDGPPYIQKLPYSEAGLSKALNIMNEAYRKNLSKIENAKPVNGKPAPRHPMINAKLKPRHKDQFSDELRANARDVLKKLKLI